MWFILSARRTKGQHWFLLWPSFPLLDDADPPVTVTVSSTLTTGRHCYNMGPRMENKTLVVCLVFSLIGVFFFCLSVMALAVPS